MYHRDRNGRLMFIGTTVTDGRSVGTVVTHDDRVIVWRATLAGLITSDASTLERVT